mgnify:CR=1 FL=1
MSPHKNPLTSRYNQKTSFDVILFIPFIIYFGEFEETFRKKKNAGGKKTPRFRTHLRFFAGGSKLLFNCFIKGIYWKYDYNYTFLMNNMIFKDKSVTKFIIGDRSKSTVNRRRTMNNSISHVLLETAAYTTYPKDK